MVRETTERMLHYLKEGKPLETAEEHLAELTTQAHEFAVKQLPSLKALQII